MTPIMTHFSVQLGVSQLPIATETEMRLVREIINKKLQAYKQD